MRCITCGDCIGECAGPCRCDSKNFLPPNTERPTVNEAPRETYGHADKQDTGKPDWSLLPWRAVSRVVTVLTLGAQKYERHGWRTVPNAKERYISAAMRHIASWCTGEQSDPETGCSHLAHAACCVLIVLELSDE